MNDAMRMIATTLAVICVSALTVAGFAAGADELPDATDVTSLTTRAEAVFNKFLENSLTPRMYYEYTSNSDCGELKEKLFSLASDTSIELQEVYELQKKTKEAIEAHEGMDWDSRYGVTGLWRKISSDIKRTLWHKCRANYYLATASDKDSREWLLRGIILMCTPAETAFAPAEAELLKIRADALSTKDADLSKSRTRDSVRQLLEQKNLSNNVYFDASILLLQNEDGFMPARLTYLAEKLTKSAYANDFEKNLKLSFLGLRGQRSDLLEKVCARWPGAETLVGRIVLSELSCEKSEEKLKAAILTKTPFEIDLAVMATRKKDANSAETVGAGAENYKTLLKTICRIEKFQSPVALYITAQGHVDSEPANAIGYYMRAATKQKEKKDKRLNLTPNRIAAQAAEFAYGLYYRDPAYKQAAMEAMVFYNRMAKKGPDQQLQYMYACLLGDCDQKRAAAELLETIAKDGGKFASQARLDLIGQRAAEAKDAGSRAKLLAELKDLIAAIGKNKQEHLAIEAMKLYCGLLLENGDKGSAQQVLAMLEGAKGVTDADIEIVRAEAMRQQGDLFGAAKVLFRISEADTPNWSPTATGILTELMNKALLRSNLAEFILLAERNAKCAGADFKDQAELIRVEIDLLAWERNEWEHSYRPHTQAEKILNELPVEFHEDIGYMRCRARLLIEMEQFDEAGRLWAQIAEANSSIGSAKTRSVRWWRAKYYQIKCFAKMPRTKKQDVEHAIEVLENSYKQIPPFWAERLSGLKSDMGR